MRGHFFVFVSCLILISPYSHAHLRQRVFRPDVGEQSGTESIVHWDTASPIKIRMHNFSGNLGMNSTNSCNSTCIDSTAARNIVKSSLVQWNGSLHAGLSGSLNLDLSSGFPYVTSNNCESTEDSDSDLQNNILFTSKANTDCSLDLRDYPGVVGLTRVQFSITDGIIKEADMQFNDVDFLLKSSGANNLDASPKEVNLNDVVTHELGHFFGLDHSTSRTSSMVYTIAEDLQTTKTDDHMGLYSLYPPKKASSKLGSLRGSLTYSTQEPIFGAAVFAIHARTLKVSASEITDVNGAFQFCYLPTGPHVFFAQQYKPASSNIHDYYSGLDGDLSTTQGTLGCLNPACKIMNTSLEHSWFSKNPTSGTGGQTLKPLLIKANTTLEYLNLVGSDSVTSIKDVSGTGQGQALPLNEVRLAKISSASVPIIGSTSSLGKDRYQVVAPSSGNLSIRTAALRIYTRLKLKLEVFESDLTTTVSCTGHPEVDTSTEILNADDPYLNCSGLTPNASYYIDVSAIGLDCKQVPGNASNCRTTRLEAVSTPQPFYLITAFESSLLDSNSGSTTALDATSLASSAYTNLPSCENYSQSVNVSDDGGGGCCGTIRDINSNLPNGPGSILLSLLLNPLTIFGMFWWLAPNFRRRLVIEVRRWSHF